MAGASKTWMGNGLAVAALSCALIGSASGQETLWGDEPERENLSERVIAPTHSAKPGTHERFSTQAVASPSRALPEPLASAPQGGLSVREMISALQNEREALLALQGEAAQEVRVPSKALKRGSKGQEAALLCEALAARSFIPSCPEGGHLVDSAMEKAIRDAQSAFGLVADGLADAQLYNALRMGASERAARLLELIEEWESIQAQADAMGASRYLVVNIPSFEAKAVGDGEIEMVSRVIVGRPGRQTPVGMMSLTALKFNPNWTPPPGILKKDVYPRMKSGGSWIDNHGLVLQDGQGNRVDWRGLSVSDLSRNGYRFVQPPGPSNALGRMKFETDSKEHIYLHDTNERSLFNHAARAKSSGCVRVKEWMDLASWAAAEKTSSLEKKLATQKTFFQKTDRIPVFVIYQLADFQEGKSTVYPDIYKRAKIAAE